MSQPHAQPMRTTQQREQEAQPALHMQVQQRAATITDATASSTAPSSVAAAASVEPQAAAQPAVEATATAASAGSKRKGAGSDVACSEESSEGSIRLSPSSAAASASSPSTACEPVIKRAKPTPPPPHTAHILNSPMMRLLGRDSGARQSLMEMLALADFVTAHRVSRLWSAWTAESARVPSVTLTEDSLVGFSHCRWLHRSVLGVEFTTPRWANGLCKRLFGDALSPCIRLRSLTLTLSRYAINSPHLRAGFSSVASTLHHLRINVSCANDQDSILVDFLSDFSAWMASRTGNERPFDPRALEAFATLMRRRKENGAAPFRRLCVDVAQLIRPDGWQSSLSQLEEIEAVWSRTMTQTDWSRLSEFQRLECLTIQRAWEIQDVLDPHPALAALIHCPRLRCLTLRGAIALGSKEAALIAQMPALQVLRCTGVHIESLAPLSSAPALTELKLVRCRGLPIESVNVRKLIPPMPFLRKLTIEDRNMMSREKAALDAVALLQRLPRLTRDQLHDDRL